MSVSKRWNSTGVAGTIQQAVLAARSAEWEPGEAQAALPPGPHARPAADAVPAHLEPVLDKPAGATGCALVVWGGRLMRELVARLSGRAAPAPVAALTPRPSTPRSRDWRRRLPVPTDGWAMPCSPRCAAWWRGSRSVGSCRAGSLWWR